ncbi:hypothetical protein M2323_003704 [Rhodoblastus acidophilus]|uniref:hypothetical protein n=1 Tax=Rhodoblastus acidophilus TaxID=1074 RepID=UPI00222508F3|nr:hypothetical protein [Rhodoblastus acidophilus]MCW2285868.1 hypothetical protein [Rhodoblastus acidophilus]MCW2334762.1 hypothetical protein [Rhodoblastus acidophilus]
MRELKKFLWLTLAGVFLFEAWLWDVLGAALASLVAVLPIKEARASFETFVKNLSPWGSLPVFVLPILPLLPLKFAALFFIAHHRVLLGVGCFVAAKLVGFAAGAYLFNLCRPKLLQIPGFEKLYNTLIRWRALAHDMIEPYRAELRRRTEFLRVRIRALRGGRGSAMVARLRARSKRWISERNG